MPDDEPHQSCKKLWLVCVVLPLMYVLSVGPTHWIWHALPRSSWDDRLESALEIIYAPLIRAGMHAPQFQEFLDWYADLM